jgi:hypothetical protein
MPSAESFSRAGGISAILGAGLLALTTWLHPLNADPNDAHAAFAEYASNWFWIATHLGQLAGIVLIGGGLLALTWRLRNKRAGIWAVLGAAAVIAAIAIAGALQAVDGIALKVMVDRLASAAPASQPMIFEAAFALRQIEIGLASILALFLGLAAVLYGTAQLSDAGRENRLGWLGIAGGAATFAGGVVQAHLGFADASMAITMPASLLLLAWAVLVGWQLLHSRD